MIETSHETIPLGGGKRKKWDPDKNCEIDKALPGWRVELEPLRQDSLSWHAIWQSSGKPNKGQLYEVMKFVRNKYHYAVRKTKKLADSIRAQKLFEQAQAGDINLLKAMKNIKVAISSMQLPLKILIQHMGQKKLVSYSNPCMKDCITLQSQFRQCKSSKTRFRP